MCCRFYDQRMKRMDGNVDLKRITAEKDGSETYSVFGIRNHTNAKINLGKELSESGTLTEI